MKKTIFAAAVCSLILTACAGAGNMTGFTEEPLAADSAEDYRYREERAAYEAKAPDKLPQEDYGELADNCTTAAGDIFYLFQTDHSQVQDQPDFEYRIVRYGSDTQRFEEIPLVVSPELYIEKILVSEAGDILLFDWKRAYVYKKGASEPSVDFPAFFMGGAIFLDETRVACKAHVSSAYLVFDIMSGEKTEELLNADFLYGNSGNNNTLIDGYKDFFLLVTGDGIYERDKAGEWKLAVPSPKTSMFLSDFAPIEAWKDGEEYYVADRSTLYHYSKAENTATEDVRLKVLSVCENSSLKEAMVYYQIEHPEVTIDYEILEQETPSDLQEMNAVLQRVNTRITSKEAADIYDLAYLPWEKYAKKGYLADLSEITEAYAESGDYYQKVLNAYAGENGTNAIPLYFYADFIFCGAQLAPYVGSIQEFAGYLAQNPDAQGLYPYYHKDNCYGFFLPMMYHFYCQDMYEEGVVTPESLRSFLESAKIIWDRLSEDEESAADPYRNAYKPYDSLGLAGIYDRDMMCAKGGKGAVLLSMDGLQVNSVNAYHMEEYTRVPTGRFHSALTIGVHQTSPQKETAMDFVKYLIEYTKNASMVEGKCYDLGGIPVYKPAVAFWMENNEKELREVNEIEDGRFQGSFDNLYIYLPVKEDGARLTEELETFDTPAPYASPLTDSFYGVLQDRSAGFFEGEKSLDRAVEEIYNGISLIEKEEG